MTWFRVDDNFWSHPKVLMLSDDALALWLRAGSWCAQQLTDGAVPAHVLSLLSAKKRSIDALVFSGLWLVTADGFQFHDWKVYQPSRDEVLKDRAANAERQRKHREAAKAKRDAGSNGVTNPVTNGGSNETPTRPDPTNKKKESAARGSRIDRNFAITAEMRKWAKEEVPLVDLDKKLPEFIDYWAGVSGNAAIKTDWVGTWRNGMRKQQGFAEKDAAAIAPSGWAGVRELGT